MTNDTGAVDYYAVRCVINERINQSPILESAQIIGNLYALNAKKIGSPGAEVVTDESSSQGSAYIYNVADMLNDVKDEGMTGRRGPGNEKTAPKRENSSAA